VTNLGIKIPGIYFKDQNRAITIIRNNWKIMNKTDGSHGRQAERLDCIQLWPKTLK
jgi:hypothetical protein